LFSAAVPPEDAVLQWESEAKDMAHRSAEGDLRLDDPRRIPYDAYLAMTEEEAAAVEDGFNTLWRPVYLNMLQERGMDWLLVCGEEVILTSNEMELPSPEEVERLARERNGIPFIVSQPAGIEESGWHSTHSPGDAYPTLAVVVEGVGVGLPLISDFDTGSPCCFFDLDQ
jgi:hypothetical protein